MQKKSSFIVLLVVLFLFGLLFGCDNQRSVCGDGVCDFLETDVRSPYYCPLDCGFVDPVCGDGGCEVVERDVNSIFYCSQDCDVIVPLDLDVLIDVSKDSFDVGEEVRLK